MTGIQSIDKDHQYLFELVSKVLMQLTAGREVELLPLQKRLNTYAAEHFMREEQLMQRYLPDWEQRAGHVREHRNYWGWIADLESTEAPEELAESLKSWWSGHVLGWDKAMGLALQRALHS